MPLIQFTRNHTDHSTDKGFQFEFFCDRCGNRFISMFRASAAGLAASALRTAGNVFGGFFGDAGSSALRNRARRTGARARPRIPAGRLRGAAQLSPVREALALGLHCDLLERRFRQRTRDVFLSRAGAG
jgi:hypothetical protein